MSKLEKQFKKLSAEDVKLALQSESADSQLTMIVRPATDDETQDNLQRLGDICVERAILKEGFEEQKQNYKTADNPLLLRQQECTRVRRTKMVEIEGMVYDVPDYTAKIMESFDEFGNLLQSRPLRKEEIHGSNMEIV